MGSSETKQSKQSRQAAAQASSGLEAARLDYLNSPQYAASKSILDQLLAQPLTLDPAAIDRIYQQGASQAYTTSQGALDQARNQSTVGAGYRSGNLRNQEYQIASGLGEGIAQAYRQAQLAAAQQRIPDLINAINAANTQVGNEFNLSQSVANARLGQAGVLSNLAQTQAQSPGLGSIFGAVAGPFAGGYGQKLGSK